MTPVRFSGVSLLMVLVGACSGDADSSFGPQDSMFDHGESELEGAAGETDAAGAPNSAADAELGSASQALTLGASCLVLPGDGLSCPIGYQGKLSGRVFRCEKPVYTDASCPLGWSQRVSTGRDPCKVILCTFGDCSDKSTSCPSGYTLKQNSSGNRDRCVKTETADPNGCFGANKGASCPSDAEQVEVVDGKFRCVDLAAPSCLPPGAAAVTPLAGADECRRGKLFVADPQCISNPNTAIFHRYEEDVLGKADQCVARGWPLPMPVL